MRSASMRAGRARRTDRRPARSASCGRNRPLNRLLLFLSRRSSDQPIPNRLLSRKLAHAAHGIGFLSRRFLGGFFVKSPSPHFPEYALALHLFLEDTERLLNVVIADKYLQDLLLALWLRDNPACQPIAQE
jgi:hypothetical protein